MKTKYVATVLAVLGLAGAPEVRAQFTPGHVFVSGGGAKPCGFGEPEALMDIDPATGEISILADCDDGIAGHTGLAFTPDGGQLLVLNAFGPNTSPSGGGRILGFHPDGTSEVILDGSDGLPWPVGSNGLAFDPAGNLYIVDRVRDAILRFPADGGPGTVFADAEDGINDSGSLAFAPNGDLFYTGHSADAIIRITPEGDASVFDSFDRREDPWAVAFDRAGNLFLGMIPGTIYRYDKGDPNSPGVLTDDFLTVWAITVSPDDSVLFAAVSAPGAYALFAVDPVDGSSTLLAELHVDDIWLIPFGIAVFERNRSGDLDGDGNVDLDDFAAFDVCRLGPGVGPVPVECHGADLDADDDVDWADFGLFQIAYTGP